MKTLWTREPGESLKWEDQYHISLPFNLCPQRKVFHMSRVSSFKEVERGGRERINVRRIKYKMHTVL